MAVPIAVILEPLLKEGVTVAVAQKVASDPKLYARLVKIANRRIADLRAARLLKSSPAYANIKEEILTPQKRKGISSLVLAGKKYGNPHKQGYLQNVISVLKFLSASTSTPSGVRAVAKMKRANFTKQILDGVVGAVPDDEVLMLNEWLDNLSDAEFRKIADIYEPIINDAFILGSYTAFEIIGQHMLEKLKREAGTKTKKAAKNIYNNLKEGVGQLLEKDPVELQSMTVSDMTKVLGFDYVLPIEETEKNPLLQAFIQKFGK